MFSLLVDEPVSYVNAPVLAADRGVDSELATEGDFEDYRSMVRVCMSCSDGTALRVAGTVTGLHDDEKLVLVAGAELDVPVSEHLLVFRYSDRPGVVGAVGGILGDAGVNIANMQVSRANADEDVTELLKQMELDASFRSAGSLGFDELIAPEETRNALLLALQRGVQARQEAAAPVARTVITP